MRSLGVIKAPHFALLPGRGWLLSSGQWSPCSGYGPGSGGRGGLGPPLDTLCHRPWVPSKQSAPAYHGQCHFPTRRPRSVCVRAHPSPCRGAWGAHSFCQLPGGTTCRLSSPPGAEHPCSELEMVQRPFLPPQAPPLPLQNGPWYEGRMLQKPPSKDQRLPYIAPLKQQGGQDTLGHPFPKTPLSSAAEKPLPHAEDVPMRSRPHRDSHGWAPTLCPEPARRRGWLGEGGNSLGGRATGCPSTEPPSPANQRLRVSQRFPAGPAMTSLFPSSTAAADLENQQPRGKGGRPGEQLAPVPSSILAAAGLCREKQAGARGTETGSAEPRRK